MLKLFVRNVKHGYATNSSGFHDTVVYTSEDQDKLDSGEYVLVMDYYEGYSGPTFEKDYTIVKKEAFEDLYTPSEKFPGFYEDDKGYLCKTGDYDDLIDAMYDYWDGEAESDYTSLTVKGVTVNFHAFYGRDG